MRERDRVERQKFERQVAAEQREAEEKRLAPIRAAEAELAKTAGKLRAKERENALHGTGDFETAYSLLSDAMKQVTPERGMTEAQASGFNEREALKFAASTPEYFASADNAELMASFCSRHGIGVADAETWGNVFRYLDGLGLMQHAPVTEPEPIIEEPAAPAQPEEEFAGIDPFTGQSRVYTRYEVEMMDSATYRRAFRVPSKWQAEYEAQRMGR